MRAAFLEVLNDVLGSVAVLLAAALIAVVGWLRADAVVSLLVGALIIPRTLRILRESVDVAGVHAQGSGVGRGARAPVAGGKG